MLFMGEEWGSKTPFPFFCDFKGDLAEAVRSGRRKEYAWAYARYGDEVPDPLDIRTFQSAVLDWGQPKMGAGQQRLKLVQELLAIRKRAIVPRLTGAAFGEAHAADNNGLLTASWRMGDGATLRLTANLSASELAHQLDHGGTAIWGAATDNPLPPWSVFWQLDPR
jgi:maltooligosyltrehalose trehalohydrolase